MGIDLATFTFIHTALSIIALVAGVVVVAGLLGQGLSSFWTTLFLITAIATSATGFGFPFNGVLPSHIIGGVALLILAAVLLARFVWHLNGPWRWIYPVGLVLSLYLLVFVAIAQAFSKVAFLHRAAPTQTELPFVLAQLVALGLFVVLAIAAAKAARPGSGLRAAT